jgi:hypothetical protein
VKVSLDLYGRTVATCSIGGVDLGEWLVSHGLALDWPHYSHGRYEAAQHDADALGAASGPGAMWALALSGLHTGWRTAGRVF